MEEKAIRFKYPILPSLVFLSPFQRLRFQFWSLKPSVNWATIISFLSRLFFSMHQNCNVFRRLIYPWLFGVYLCDIWLFQFRHFWEICSLCTKFLFEVWDMQWACHMSAVATEFRELYAGWLMLRSFRLWQPPRERNQGRRVESMEEEKLEGK